MEKRMRLCRYKQEPCQNTQQNFFQTPNLHLAHNHIFPNYFPLAKANMRHRAANSYTVTIMIPKKKVIKLLLLATANVNLQKEPLSK